MPERKLMIDENGSLAVKAAMGYRDGVNKCEQCRHFEARAGTSYCGKNLFFIIVAPHGICDYFERKPEEGIGVYRG